MNKKVYCRYCSFCILGDWYYCTFHDRVLKRVDVPKLCKNYVESELGDVETGKKYKPRAKANDDQIALQFGEGGD